jgi:hypothetical protein
MHRAFLLAAYAGLAESAAAATIRQWELASLLALCSLCSAVVYVWRVWTTDD